LQEAAARLRRLGEEDLFRHAVPKEAGGHGDGFAGLVATHEALGLSTRDPGLILAVNAHLFGALFPLLRFGNEAQRAAYLPLLLGGQWLGGHAITEPDAGSDTAAMRCTATADSDGFLLGGHKRYITNTPIEKPSLSA